MSEAELIEESPLGREIRAKFSSAALDAAMRRNDVTTFDIAAAMGCSTDDAGAWASGAYPGVAGVCVLALVVGVPLEELCPGFRGLSGASRPTATN